MPLTWRNVAGPNFGDSNQSFALAADLFNRTMEGARAGLDRTDDRISANVNNAFQTELLKYKDAEDLEAALVQDPTLGIRGGDRISANSRGLADGRIGSLMGRDNARFDRAVAESRYGIEVREDARLVEGRDLREAASPAIAEARKALASGDRAAYQAAIESPEFQAMRGEQRDGVFRDIQGYASGDLGLRQGQFGFDQSVLGVQRREEVARIADQLRQNSFTQQEAIGNLDGLGIADPIIKQAVLSELGRTSFIGDGLGGGGSGGGLGSGGAFTIGADQSSVIGVLRNGQVSDAAIAGILGNLEVEGGYGGALGDGGTASGIAQWRGGRRDAFRRQYGKDPHEASKEQQAEFILWELTTPEGRQVAGISEQKANAILNAKDPAEAARLFDQHYERSDGKHRERRVQAAMSAAAAMAPVSAREGAARDTAANTGYSNTLSGLNANSMVQAYVKNIAFDGDFNAALEQAPGWLKEVPRNQLLGAVSRVKTQARQALGDNVGLNDAQALAILGAAEQPYSWSEWGKDFFRFGSDDRDIGTGTMFDQDLIDQGIKDIAGTNIDNARARRDSLQFSVSERNAAQQELQQAENALDTAKKRNLQVNNPQMYQRILRAAQQARVTFRAIDSQPDNRSYNGGVPEVEGGTQSNWLSNEALNRAGANRGGYNGFDASEYTRLFRGQR